MEGKLGRIQMAVENFRAQRRASIEAGHTPEPVKSFIDAIPEDEEIILFEKTRECLDTKAFDIYHPSITQEWLDADPAEDRINSPLPSRIDPSS